MLFHRSIRIATLSFSAAAAVFGALACAGGNAGKCTQFGACDGEGGSESVNMSVGNGSGLTSTTSGNPSGDTSTAAGLNVATTGSGSGGAMGCAGLSVAAQPKPVDIFIQFDKSGSMAEDNKWSDAQAAMSAFFQDPASAGLSIALHFFPTNTCNEQQCDTTDCGTDQVPIGMLTSNTSDAQRTALVNALLAESPNGGTPTRPALQGVENTAQTYQIGHKGEQVVVLFVTDGIPMSNCDDTQSTIPPIAAAALANAGVLTYAIGLEGSQQSFMDQIAQAGGTMASIQIQAGGMAEMQLLAALKSIQNNSVACQYQLPMPMNGMTVDPTEVNVTYTPGGGMPEELSQVSSSAACGASGGWYYDNETAPTTITLCPSTCTTVQADSMASVQVVLGCKTKVQ